MLPLNARTISIAIRNIVVGSSLSTLSLAANPRAMMSAINESLFLVRTMAGRRRVVQKNVFEGLQCVDRIDISLAYPKEIDNWFWPVASYAADIVNICQITRIVQPKTIFEIGTFRGYTSLHFAINSPESAKIYTLDLPPFHEANPALSTTEVDQQHIDSAVTFTRMAYSDYEEGVKVTRLFGDSAVYDFSPYYGSVDLFFVDGAHSYDYVRSDTLNALRCCHRGSVIMWHDYGRMGVNGVSTFLDRLSRKYDIYSTPGGSLAYMVVP